MGGKNKRKQATLTVAQLSHKFQQIERSVARVAPYQVENYDFTVTTIINLNADTGTLAGQERIARMGITGNGIYNYAVTSPTATPNTQTNVPQQKQVDLQFAMYKFWTPLAVKIKVFPHSVEYEQNSTSSAGRTLVHRPWAVIKDLSIDCESDLQLLAAKGVKPFTMHPAKQAFTAEFHDLDRVAMQKQKYNTFETRGSWAQREQMEDPAGLVLWAVSPSAESLNSYGGFGTVQIEFRLRMSERNAPGKECLPGKGTHMLNASVKESVAPGSTVQPQSEESLTFQSAIGSTTENREPSQRQLRPDRIAQLEHFAQLLQDN